MSCIPIFAGLGSDSLFLDSAAEAIQTPESRILLQACWTVFHSELRHAFQSGVLDEDSVDLADFDAPEKLLQPPLQYNCNSVIQHSTLYLLQMVRHLDSNKGVVLATAGFCAGLLPAAAISTSKGVIELLSRAQDLYYVAMWLGIRSESFKVRELNGDLSSRNLPWSIIVDGLSAEQARDEVAASEEQNRIWVTATNAPHCVTLSGRGDNLQAFISEKLSNRFRTRPASVYSLYHNRERLSSVKQEILRDLQQRSALLSFAASFAVPLAGTSDGAWIDLQGTWLLERLISMLLDLILLEPTDWPAVQASIASLARDQVTDSSAAIEIVNYGPGYGMSASAQKLPKEIKVVNLQPSAERISPNDIAIVGMGVDLPDAPDVATFWENLSKGVDSCTEIPSSRFNIDEFYQNESRPQKNDRTLKVRHGNFMQNPFMFDNELFDISRREARSMDPQQRVMLQVAYRALENAGYTPDSTPSNQRGTFGCWIGNATIDYTNNLRNDIDVYYSPGTLRTFQSARISYVFGWSGPSITLDTACSSSVVALHQAARAIAAGDCRSALVGAVNTITSPDMYLGLDRAHFLSPSGQCKSFDSSADGYCRAEGCGAFVIKKVEDAIADGDRIHAIIKAVEINQSGNTHSITHPHVLTQQALLKSIFSKTRISPHEVTAVELHGTGTQAGDPNEVTSVRHVLCTERDPANTVYFTSVKANIGHCEAASGMAGLAKLILMLKNSQIPPQISLKTLNPKIREFGLDGALISGTGASWVRRGGRPRLALLNNFGAGGSNGAVLVQEFVDQAGERGTTSSLDFTQFIGISAKSEKSVTKLRDTLVTFLSSATDYPFLRDVCATMTSRRLLQDYRIAVTGGSVADLIHNLKAAEPRKIAQRKSGGVIFAFSGQGSQYLGMGGELMSSSEIFVKTVTDCDQWLISHEYPGCKEIIEAGEDDGLAAKDAAKLQAFQSAIFVLEVAVARMLTSWNIMPAAVLGHSLGEYAALVTAGVIDLVDGLALVAGRAKLMHGLCEHNSSAMLAVNSSAAKVQGMIHADQKFRDLAVSCSNSKTDCVIGGPRTLLDEFQAVLTGVFGVKCKLLGVPMAFHTAAMDPILNDLTSFAQNIDVRTPKIPVVSNLYGRVVWPGENTFNAEYFASHCRSMVAFDDGAANLLASKVGLNVSKLIEIGPHPSLLPALSQMVGAAGMTVLPTIRKGIAPSTTLTQLMCDFYLTKPDVDWRKVFADGGKVRLIDLPELPFFQEEFRVAYEEHGTASEQLKGLDSCSERRHGFIQRVVTLPSSQDSSAIFETPLDDLRELIVGHVVGDYALCPASVYHEMALSAVAELGESSLSGSIWTLSQVSYTAPLLFQDKSGQALRVTLEPFGGDYRFRLTTNAVDGQTRGDTTHCEGLLLRKQKMALQKKWARKAPALRRRRDNLAAAKQVFTTKAMYDKIFTRVVKYSTSYQKVTSLRLNEDVTEVVAICEAPDARVNGCELPAAKSIFMDVLLHVAGFAANFNAKNDTLCICKEVGVAQILRLPGHPGERFEIVCTLTEIASEHLTVADAYALDPQGEIMAQFKGMAFQSVSLAKISAVFATIRAKAMSVAPNRLTSLPSQQVSAPIRSRKQSRLSQSAISHSMVTISIAALVAKTCGLPEGSISADSRLDALGVDSLMMLELQSELIKSGIQADMAAMAKCETVKDMECVCGSTPMDLSPSSSTGTESGAFSNATKPMTPYTPTEPLICKSEVLLAIADTCGADADAILSDSALQSLGIDSLMMLELHVKLEKIANGRTCSMNELSDCATVGDIERLVCN